MKNTERRQLTERAIANGETVSGKDPVIKAVNEWKENKDYMASCTIERHVRAELLALVRSRRNAAFRAKIDSEALVYAALKSFLSGVRNEEFSRIDSERDVKRILSAIAFRMLIDQVREFSALKRSVQLESEKADAVDVLADNRPTPAECAEAIDDFEKFHITVRDVHPSAIKILELSIEGMTPSEIAKELGLGVRVVQIIIRKMIDHWKEQEQI